MGYGFACAGWVATLLAALALTPQPLRACGYGVQALRVLSLWPLPDWPSATPCGGASRTGKDLRLLEVAP